MSLSVGNAALLPGRNLIGSEWREAALGALRGCGSRHRQGDRACARQRRARCGRGRHGGAPGLRGLAPDPAKVRAQIIKRWNALLHENAEDLARLISSEQGKPLAEARGEVSYAASYVEWFAEEATRADGDLIPSPAQGRRMFALREPVGVVAAITPWNFPAAMIARKIARPWRPGARSCASRPRTRR